MTDYTNKKNIPEINTVEGFVPAEFTRALPNEDGTTSLYMDVKYRLLWFRLHCPNGKTDPELISTDDKSAIVCCKVYRDKADPADQYIGKGYAQRFKSEEKYGDRFLEIAETAALGRALAAAGYGTQFCGAADMLTTVIADAPIDLDDAGEIELPQTSQEAPSATEKVSAPKPIPVPPPQSTPSAEQTKPTPAPTSVDDYLNSMSIEEAERVVIDVGFNKGKTLGEIAVQRPRDLAWYVDHYSGKNHALKAAAILLMSKATQKAS